MLLDDAELTVATRTELAVCGAAMPGSSGGRGVQFELNATAPAFCLLFSVGFVWRRFAALCGRVFTRGAVSGGGGGGA
jgi:hypothetical protein